MSFCLRVWLNLTMDVIKDEYQISTGLLALSLPAAPWSEGVEARSADVTLYPHNTRPTEAHAFLVTLQILRAWRKIERE